MSKAKKKVIANKKIIGHAPKFCKKGYLTIKRRRVDRSCVREPDGIYDTVKPPKRPKPSGG